MSRGSDQDHQFLIPIMSGQAESKSLLIHYNIVYTTGVLYKKTSNKRLQAFPLKQQRHHPLVVLIIHILFQAFLKKSDRLFVAFLWISMYELNTNTRWRGVLYGIEDQIAGALLSITDERQWRNTPALWIFKIMRDH